jgi:hypothetical protein
MAKDETEIGITGKPIPKKKRSPKKQYEFEKKRRENLGQNVGGRTYSSDVTPHFNPRSVREEVLVDYLLGEGFASDEKSAQAIAGAMSEDWVKSIMESEEEKEEPQKRFTGEGPKKPKGWKPTGPKLKTGQRPGYAR